MYKNYFITGIGTGVGKTLVSAVLCRKFGFSYWKPVQTGSADGTDSEFIRLMINDIKGCEVYKEKYIFPQPLSPHYAAELNNVKIELGAFRLPDKFNGTLVIEGAGGILVPLNDECFMSDLCKYLNAELVVVVSDYLGCINHSLLTFEYLKNRKMKVKGIILNGNFSREVERIILKYSPFPLLAKVPRLNDINRKSIDYAIQSELIQFNHAW